MNWWAEALSKIGRLYNVPIDELKRLNGLSGETIRTGDVLLIPER
jgi:LysM repeat protein